MTVLTQTNHTPAFADKTVGAVAAADYRITEVFTRHGIDYCCGGDKTIRQACAEQQISPAALLAEITEAVEKNGAVHSYNEWALDFLADYITNEHHAYVHRMTPLLSGMLDAVVTAHGDHHPEVLEVQRIWQSLSGELIMHIQKEDLMLFPFIKRLVRSQQAGEQLAPPRFGSAAELIGQMEEDHESTGDELAALADLTNDFTAPEDACNTFSALYGYLAEFQKKTKEHVHLENNILFPKAIVLEQQQVAQ